MNWSIYGDWLSLLKISFIRSSEELTSVCLKLIAWRVWKKRIMFFFKICSWHGREQLRRSWRKSRGLLPSQTWDKIYLKTVVLGLCGRLVTLWTLRIEFSQGVTESFYLVKLKIHDDANSRCNFLRGKECFLRLLSFFTICPWWSLRLWVFASLLLMLTAWSLVWLFVGLQSLDLMYIEQFASRRIAIIAILSSDTVHNCHILPISAYRLNLRWKR